MLEDIWCKQRSLVCMDVDASTVDLQFVPSHVPGPVPGVCIGGIVSLSADAKGRRAWVRSAWWGHPPRLGSTRMARSRPSRGGGVWGA